MQYICPMHPEVVRDVVGPCPICGMVLEPAMPSIAQRTSELDDMTRRFWASLACTLPVLIAGMSEMVPGDWIVEDVVSANTLNVIVLIVATPAIVWGGWPCFVRAVESVRNGSLNMFTLIGLGVSVSYPYSFVASAAPALFPDAFRGEGGAVGECFEVAAAIVTLVLLGQVFELRARSRTDAVVTQLLEFAPRTALRFEPDGTEREIQLDEAQKVGFDALLSQISRMVADAQRSHRRSRSSPISTFRLSFIRAHDVRPVAMHESMNETAHATTSEDGSGNDAPLTGSFGEVFRVALVLGLTSFGGPIAHLGYFHREYVARRAWLSEHAYADLVALCQFLPGPASSQLGLAIGMRRAGWGGALAAWIGFTLPSAILLTAFAFVSADIDIANAGWIHGLRLAAVAVVATAVWSMWRSLTPDLARKSIAVVAAAAVLVAQTASLQVLVILAGAIAGWLLLRSIPLPPPEQTSSPVSRRAGAIALMLFAALLLALPLASLVTNHEAVAVFDAFYRAGALVFGGGHVVLPLLHEAVVDPGWVSDEAFLTGYGATQAVPGPLFTFAAYLGASLGVAPSGVAGAAFALFAIFLPASLLVVGVLPFWDALGRSARFRAALAGTNAAVTGLLIAALYNPVWTSAVSDLIDVVLVLVAFLALVVRNVAPWIVVASLAVAGEAVHYFL